MMAQTFISGCLLEAGGTGSDEPLGARAPERPLHRLRREDGRDGVHVAAAGAINEPSPGRPQAREEREAAIDRGAVALRVDREPDANGLGARVAHLRPVLRGILVPVVNA